MDNLLVSFKKKVLKTNNYNLTTLNQNQLTLNQRLFFMILSNQNGINLDYSRVEIAADARRRA